MKEDEDNETMYSRFQTLVSGLQVLKKIYTIPDNVKQILSSLLLGADQRLQPFRKQRI